MATLTISITAGVTTTQTMNFNSADATRIMNAYKVVIDAGGDQSALNGWLAQQAKASLVSIVAKAETVAPAAPSIT